MFISKVKQNLDNMENNKAACNQGVQQVLDNLNAFSAVQSTVSDDNLIIDGKDTKPDRDLILEFADMAISDIAVMAEDGKTLIEPAEVKLADLLLEFLRRTTG